LATAAISQTSSACVNILPLAPQPYPDAITPKEAGIRRERNCH